MRRKQGEPWSGIKEHYVAGRLRRHVRLQFTPQDHPRVNHLRAKSRDTSPEKVARLTLPLIERRTDFVLI